MTPSRSARGCDDKAVEQSSNVRVDEEVGDSLFLG